TFDAESKKMGAATSSVRSRSARPVRGIDEPSWVFRTDWPMGLVGRVGRTDVAHPDRPHGPISPTLSVTRCDLAQRVVTQTLVVFPGEIPLDALRRDHHGEIDCLVPNLLQRPVRLELNLALGVLDDQLRLAARLLTDLLTQPVAVGPALRDDRVGFLPGPRD